MLHVGNFLGVSLAWFADSAGAWHQDSLVVTVDPNVTHRGVERPQEHVIDLLTTFGLEDRVLRLTGYTLAKNPSVLPEVDAAARFARDRSCARVLPNLALWSRAASTWR